MSKKEFIIGWLLLTFLLFSLCIIIRNLKSKKSYNTFKQLNVCIAIKKIVLITNTITKMKINKDSLSPDNESFKPIIYFAKINYWFTENVNKNVEIPFLFTLNTMSGGAKFNLALPTGIVEINMMDVLKTHPEKFCKKLSRKNRKLLGEFGILENLSNSRKSGLSMSIKGIFIDNIEDINESRDFESLDLEQLELINSL